MSQVAVISLKKLNPKISVGGAQSLILWLVNVLQDKHNVSFLHVDKKININRLNEIYGTKLSLDKIKLLKIPELPFSSVIPYFWLLKRNFTMRKLKSLISGFDVLISARGETDLGRPVIQYIVTPKPGFFLQETSNFLEKFYCRFCNFVYPRSLSSMKNNLTLSCSFYIAQRAESIYGIKSKVVYPPVIARFPKKIPWEKRENGFVLISRIEPPKNIHKVIAILKEVKKQKPDIHLHISGVVNDKKYGKYIAKIIKENRDWIFYKDYLPRNEYLNLISRHKYGINGKIKESFGIGVAEMVKAGSIVFVPANGGQVEIVGDSLLIYSSGQEAAAKILKVMGDDSSQRTLRERLKENSKKFSAECFSQKINQVVDNFLANL